MVPFYFVHRIGGTFCCKGENVATFEVASATVYGVHVPGRRAPRDSRVVLAGELDLVKLRKHLTQRLPACARPLFAYHRQD